MTGRLEERVRVCRGGGDRDVSGIAEPGKAERKSKHGGAVEPGGGADTARGGQKPGSGVEGAEDGAARPEVKAGEGAAETPGYFRISLTASEDMILRSLPVFAAAVEYGTSEYRAAGCRAIQYSRNQEERHT